MVKVYQTLPKRFPINKDILEKHIKEKTCPLMDKDKKQILGYLVDYKEDDFAYTLVYDIDDSYKNMFSPWKDDCIVSSRGQNLPEANNGNAGLYFSNKKFMERLLNENNRSKN